MGGDEVAAGESILRHAGIPAFPYPDTAARAFNHMWRYSQNIRSLYETPVLAGGEDGGADRAGAEELIASVHASGRTALNRNRIEAAARVVPHPRRADPGRRHGGAGRRPRGGTRAAPRF